MADIKGLLKDDEFWGATPKDRRQILSGLDPEFAALSLPEQDQFLREFQPDKKGFFGGVWETLNPVESLKFAKDVFTTSPFAEEQPLNLLFKGSAKMHVEQFSKAGEAVKAGKDATVAARVAAGVIPFMGPMVAETTERIADPETRARGIGNVLGMAIPGFVGKYGPRTVRPKVKIQGAGPMTVGERLRSPTVRRAEGIIEGSVPGSGPFSRLRKEQQQYLSGQGDDIVASLSKFEGSSEDLGIFIKDALAKDTVAIKESAQKLYSAVDTAVTSSVKRVPTTVDVPMSLYGPTGQPLGSVQKKVLRKALAGGIQPRTAPLKAEAVPLLRRLNEQAKLLGPTEMKSARDQLVQIINSPKTLSFTAFHDSRKDLLAIARRLEKGLEPSSGRLHATTLRMADKMDQAMEDALTAGGRKDLVADLKEANQIWREMNIDYNKTLLAKIQAQPPEKAHRLLLQQGTSIEDIRKLKRHVSKESFDLIVARAVRDLIDDSTEGELVKRAGGAVSQILDLPEEIIPVLNGKSLGKKLEALARQGKLGELVDAQTHASLIEIVQIAKSFKPRGGGLPSGMINVSVMAPLFYNPLDVQGLATGAGIYGIVNVMARGLTTQGGSSLMRDVFRAAARGDRQLLMFSLKRMSEMAERGELSQPANEGRREPTETRVPPTLMPRLTPMPLTPPPI